MSRKEPNPPAPKGQRPQPPPAPPKPNAKSDFMNEYNPQPSDLVKGKELVWEEQSDNHLRAYVQVAIYCIGLRTGRAVVWYDDREHEWIEQYPKTIDIDQAKAACQAHYNNMLMSQLEVR